MRGTEGGGVKEWGVRTRVVVGVVALFLFFASWAHTAPTGARQPARSGSREAAPMRASRRTDLSALGVRGSTLATTRATTLATTLATTCYTYAHADPRGDTTGHADVVSSSLSFDCVKRQWRLAVAFAAPVSTKTLLTFAYFNTDGNAANHCGGDDYYVAVAWVASANSLRSAWGSIDSKCQPHFIAALTPSRSSSRSVAVVFPAVKIPEDNGWWVLTSGLADPVQNSDFDFSPVKGWWPAKSTKSSAFTAVTKFAGLTGSYQTPIPTADFNGDRHTDMLLYAPGTAQDWIYRAGVNSFARIPITITGRYTQLVAGDFDGDSYGDILFYTAGTGSDRVWYGSISGSFTSAPLTINGSYRLVTGDFNCDGRVDVVLARTRGGHDTVLYGQANRTFGSGAVDVGPGYATSGDFNGDGCADLLVWQSGSAADSLVHGSASGLTTPSPVSINGAYAMARVGDFNDDDISDVLFVNPGPGPDAIALGSTTGSHITPGPAIVVAENYVDAVVGDFNNDGSDDIYFAGPNAVPERLWHGNKRPNKMLPWSGFSSALVVDPQFHRVYVTSGGANDDLAIYDKRLNLLAHVSALPDAEGVAFDATTVYVAVHGADEIARFNRATLTSLTPIDTSGSTSGPTSLVFAHGRLWFAFDGGTQGQGGLGSFDPATDTIRVEGIGTRSSPAVYGSAFAPDQLLLTESINDDVERIDVSSGSATVAASRSLFPEQCWRLTFSPDATEILAACSGGNKVFSFDPATLASRAGYGGPSMISVGVTTAFGGRIVGGGMGTYGPDVFTYVPGRSSPVALFDFGVSSYNLQDIAIEPNGTTVYAIRCSLNCALTTVPVP